MQAIKDYLTDAASEYQAGVALLEGVSNNRHLVKGLRNKENEANVRKLRFELARYVGEPALAALPTVAQVLEAELGPAPAPDAPAPLSIEQSFAQLPAEQQEQVASIVARQAAIFNQQGQLSNALADQLSDERRLAIVEQQEQLEAEYNRLSEEKTWLLAGAPAPAAAATEAAPLTDRAALKSRQLALRTQISKAKGKLKSTKTAAKKSEYEQKIAQAQAELNHITLQLKAADGAE